MKLLLYISFKPIQYLIYTCTDAFATEDVDKGRKNETHSTTETEQHVLTEPTALSSTSPLPHAPQRDVSDPHGQEAALRHCVHIADQKSYHLQADKCSDVEMSPVTVLSVPSTGTMLATDQHNSESVYNVMIII